MSAHDHNRVHETTSHSSTRREILGGMGVVGAAAALSTFAAGAARGQSGTPEMPDSIGAAANQLRGRQMSVTELTKACLKRAKELQPKLNAFITVSETEALATAAELDRELARGQVRDALHGIPVVYK